MSTARNRLSAVPRPVVLTGLVVAQLALVAVAVAPQLSARATGETHLLRTQPIDPIDPFRGAYVTLSYPGLQADWDESGDEQTFETPNGDVYVELLPEAEGSDVLEPGRWLTAAPDAGPYLACVSDGWRARCGIESFFVSQDRARSLEQGLRNGGVAEVKVDSRGNAAVVDVRED
ncbi:GDYXXLXY domain-containing protein [Nocardioides yefusunii]|uniref:GDYXXLXY domain-containing protein n=1 Tax=Nocardioides yefusunii TaxID=2500546 RepID=A0ABW1QZH6_9ACTN|nr:GDYXXLXY domain-containing protein [Nocardioides yefusunii]